MDNSTIAAIATPGGRGGIGIIKISGTRALSIASAIFSPASFQSSTASGRTGYARNNFADSARSHQLYYGHVIDPENLRVLDEVLLSVMKAPRSYTREDVVEINAHGGQVAVNAILELVLRQGARISEPGEFTRRAFLNGRIDLTQAEAVIDVINARTEKSLQLATAQAKGTLGETVGQIRDRLIELLTRTEAGIDFPDDVDEVIDPKSAISGLDTGVIEPLEVLIQRHLEGNVLRDGLKVAVVGRPNVGKSSLLNCLAQKERAIVTALPGTTRDAIEENLNINGYPVVLVDTAGLHETSDPIETIGIEKTIANINGANLVLFMVEADRKLTVDDRRIYDQFRSKPTIVVINKIDLIDSQPVVKIPDDWGTGEPLKISALFDRGIDALKKQIVASAFGDNPIDIDSGILPNIRQKLVLEAGLSAAQGLRRELIDGSPMELVAIQLQEAIETLGQIIGTSVKVDVLDQIFSRFCIGK
jgi:tRNA modification GTPase